MLVICINVLVISFSVLDIKFVVTFFWKRNVIVLFFYIWSGDPYNIIDLSQTRSHTRTVWQHRAARALFYRAACWWRGIRILHSLHCFHYFYLKNLTLNTTIWPEALITALCLCLGHLCHYLASCTSHVDIFSEGQLYYWSNVVQVINATADLMH